METVKLCGLEWMAENLTRHGGTEINGNTYYTWEQAKKAAEEVGDGWRLPTREEFITLCDLESTWDEERKGRWFGENKELFLPAFGTNDSLLNILVSVGHGGYYWGSSLLDSIYANYLYFCSYDVYPKNYTERKNELSVRLVRDIK